MLNAHEFNLFITPGSLPPVLHMGQYDSGRQWTAKLKNRNGEAYTPPSGATATIAGTNKKRVSWILDADISGSSVTFTPEGAATDQFGKMQVTLTIENDGEQITALALIFDIQKAGVTNEEAATSPEFETAMQEAAAEAVEEAMTEAGILFAANQDTKSNAMTQPVGVDGNGKLWVQPVGSEGAVTPEALLAAAVQLTTPQEATFRADIGAGTYSKPTAGIPKNDLASAVRSTLDKADTAYQKPVTGIPASDMAQAVQTALTAAGTAVQPAALASYVPRAQQATKASNQTQEVGIDANGKLWVQPPGSGGGGVEKYYVHITQTQNGFVSDKSFTEISVADAAAKIIVPTFRDFEGRVVKLADNYAHVEVVDLTLPQIPILWAFTITDTGTAGTGIDIGGAAYVYLTKNGDDYDIDTTNTPEILRTRGNVLNYFYDGVAVKLMVNGYAHPLVYHYGDGILKFGGPEYTVVNGHHVQQDVVYTWSTASHIAREVVTPLNADSLAAKTSAMTQAVGYDANTGTLWTVPGEGGGSYTPETVVLTMTVGAMSTELSVALSFTDLSAKIAAGARLVSQMTVGYDTVGIEWHVNGANTTQQGINLYTIFEDTNGENLLIAYLSETGTDEMSGVVESHPVGNAKNPTITPKTGASPSAFSLADNIIYECETLTALTITSAPASGSSIITFTSGATATTASFPATVEFSDDQPDVTNGVFVPSANYAYEINIRNRKALVSRWAVSA